MELTAAGRKPALDKRNNRIRMENFKHIIFDLGNVLVNIHPEETMNRFAYLCRKEYSKVQAFFMSKIHLDFIIMY